MLIKFKFIALVIADLFYNFLLFIKTFDYKSKFKDFLKKIFKRLLMSLIFTFFFKSYLIDIFNFFVIAETVDNSTKSLDLTKIGITAVSAFALGYLTFVLHRSFSNFVRDEVVSKVYMDNIIHDMSIYSATYSVYIRHYVYYSDLLGTETFFTAISNLDLHYKYVLRKIFPTLLGLDLNDTELNLLKKCIDIDPQIVTFDIHQLRMLAFTLKFYAADTSSHLVKLTKEANCQITDQFFLIKPHEYVSSLVTKKMNINVTKRLASKDYDYSVIVNHLSEFSLNKGLWVATLFNDPKLTDLAIRGMMDLSSYRYDRIKNNLPPELGVYSLQRHLPLLNQDNSLYQLISIGLYPIFSIFSFFGFVNPIPSEVFWHLVYKTPLNFINSDVMKELRLNSEDHNLGVHLDTEEESLDVYSLKDIVPNKEFYVKNIHKFLSSHGSDYISVNYIKNADDTVYDEIKKDALKLRSKKN